MNVATKSAQARARREALAKERAPLGNLFVVAADAVLYQSTRRGEEGPVHDLHYVDCWTDQHQVTTFSTEVELYKFAGEFLSEVDGPTEEFMKRFPKEFE